MNPNATQAISPDTFQASRGGVRFELRPYISRDGEQRLIFNISGAKGNNAVLQPAAPRVHTPQERTVRVDGSVQSSFTIPRWLSDSLVAEFEQLAAQDGVTLATTATDSPLVKDDSDDGKDLSELLD